MPPLVPSSDSTDSAEKGLLRDKDTSSRSKLQIVAGFYAVLGWVTCSAVSAICVQLIERRIPDFQLNTARLSLPWIGSVVILLITRRIPILPWEIIPWVVPAIVVQNIQSLSNYIGVSYIPLASFQCSVNTVTLASGVLVHTCINNDRLHLAKIVAIFLAIVGIGFVTQPEFLYPLLGLSDHKTQGNVGKSSIIVC